MIFNVAKGSWAGWVESDNTKGVILLMTVNEADDTLADYDDVAALLLAAGNTEAVFTNYVRKTVTITLTTDDTNNEKVGDFPDQAYVSAGGTVDETMTIAIVCYSAGAGDVNLKPISSHAYIPTTDGSTLDLVVHEDGFIKSQ